MIKTMGILIILIFALGILVADTFYRKGYANGWDDCYGGLIRRRDKASLAYTDYMGNPEDLEGD